MASRPRGSYVAEELPQEPFDAIFVAFIPGGSAFEANGDIDYQKIRNLLEERLESEEPRGARIRVISIVPGSLIVTFGAIFLAGYKLVADYSKVKESIPKIAQDAKWLLQRMGGVQVRVVTLAIAGKAAVAPSRLKEAGRWLAKAWSYYHEEIFAAVIIVGLVFFPLVNCVLLWLILRRLP
jgi:hypothetical protein